MNPELERRIVARYPGASAWDRFHLRQRLRRSCYEHLLPHLPRSGNLLDIGCGFGQLRWFLEESRVAMDYFGSDIDVRKIELGKPAFGSKSNQLVAGDFREWGGLPGFSAITILDVLYLLPLSLQEDLLAAAFVRLRTNPDSVLILKILPKQQGLNRWRTWLQERLMVGLGKTLGSGALFASQDPELYLVWGRARKFIGKIVPLPVSPASLLVVFRPA